MIRSTYWLAVLAGLYLSAGPVRADAPPALKRALAKEPAYQNSPRYFVLLFGLKAETQVWCVHDGDILYVDKNNSGDLTESGKRIRVQDTVTFGDTTIGYPGGAFYIDEIRSHDGKAVYRHLRIGRYRSSYSVEAELVGLCSMYSSLDHTTKMDRIEDAPFCHLHGPLEMYLLSKKLVRKNDEIEVAAAVATLHPGGEWSFVRNESGFPSDAHPTAEVTFPGKTPLDKPIVMRAALTKRC